MEGSAAGESMPDDQALLNALEAISTAGIPHVGAFLMAFLTSEHPRVQKQVDQFLRESFDGVMAQLMDKSYYGPTRRQTTKQTGMGSVVFGKRLIDWVVKILMQEMKDTAGDSRAKLSPSNLKPHHALDFSFRQVENLFTERAPLTFRLVNSLCGVRDGEHAGQRTYLSSICANSDLCDSADELGDVEEGWDEGDSWRDDNQRLPEIDLDLLPHTEAPPASGDSAMQASSTGKGRRIARRRLQKKHGTATSRNIGDFQAENGDQFRESVDDLDVQDVRGGPGKRRRPRRVRNKAIIASTVLAQMLYAHNQSANAFQTIVAAYSFASRTGKRVTAVLNQLGLSVSPTTFASALKHNSSAACAVVREGIQAGRKVGLFYDNLVIYDKKAEESEVNKNRSLQLTACGGYFLQLPAESAEAINSAHDPTLNYRTRDTCQNGTTATPNPLCAETPRPTSDSPIGPSGHVAEFDPLDSPRANASTRHATGIESKLLLHPNPDYSTLQTLDILHTGTIHKHYEETVKGHLCILLRKHFNQAMLKNPTRGLLGKEYALKTLFQMPIMKSEVFTLPTLDLDESTIDGNAAILETLVGSIGFTLEGLQESIIPISGDQMTLGRIRGVQELRVRDRLEHRAKYAEPWMGFLHFGFATVDVIKRCNSGTAGGGDPGSLSTFVQLLGRTGILDSKPNFNAIHRLVEEIGEASNLAGFMEVAGVKTMAELERKIETCDWIDLVDKVYEEYFPLNKVGALRANALREATILYEEKLDDVRAVRATRRTQAQKDFLALSKPVFIQAESDKQRDLAYENSLLLMQQVMVHHDFYCAMRKGDSGRLEKSLELFLVLFEGSGKGNYAQELLEQQIDREVLWTPYMRALWLRNCLLNISGAPNKFLAVDEVCEYLVRQLKSSYNPKNTWQSKQFHMETLSRLTMLFRDIRRIVQASSGAPSFGTRHSQVDSSRDIGRLTKYLMEEELLYYHGGRSQISRLHNARRITESLDAWTLGNASYGTGAPLARAIGRRIERQVAGMEYHSPLSTLASVWNYCPGVEDTSNDFIGEEDLVEGAHVEVEVEFDISDSSSDGDI